METPAKVKALEPTAVYVGDYNGRQVFALPIVEDNGAGTGYPEVYLYDGENVETINAATDHALFVFLNEHA
jgi:hypothetical protein